MKVIAAQSSQSGATQPGEPVADPAPTKWDVTFTIQVDYDRNYMVCFSTYPARPGETWARGNDCGDGRLTEETICNIMTRIAAYVASGKPERETVQ